MFALKTASPFRAANLERQLVVGKEACAKRKHSSRCPKRKACAKRKHSSRCPKRKACAKHQARPLGTTCASCTLEKPRFYRRQVVAPKGGALTSAMTASSLHPLPKGPKPQQQSLRSSPWTAVFWPLPYGLSSRHCRASSLCRDMP